MISVAAFKGRPNVTGEFVFNISTVNYDRIYLRSITNQTVWVTNRDGITQTVNLVANTYQLIYKAVTTTANLPVIIKVSDREKITAFGVVYITGIFPNISLLTSLNTLTIHGWNLVDFNSPSLLSVQNRLKYVGFEDGWSTVLTKPDVVSFLQGLTQVEEFVFRYNSTFHDIVNYTFIGYHSSKIKRLTFLLVSTNSIPDITANTALTYLSFSQCIRVVDGGIKSDVVDKLPNTNTLKTIILSNNNATNANINGLIDKIYTWANTNSNNNVNLNIGGNNAAPSGTYDGTTDWSGGVPTSPKAKLWHLVNSRSWIITYTA